MKSKKNISKFLIFTLAFSIFLSCATLKNFTIGSMPLKAVATSRALAMENTLYNQKTSELLLLKRNNDILLKELAKKMEDENIALHNDKVIYLIDYIVSAPVYYTHVGLLWSNDFYIRYMFDLKKRRITLFEMEGDFDKYNRQQAYIPLDLLKFLEEVEKRDDFKDVPVSGRTPSGHCVFSRINAGKSNEVQSYAFWQY